MYKSYLNKNFYSKFNKSRYNLKSKPNYHSKSTQKCLSKIFMPTIKETFKSQGKGEEGLTGSSGESYRLMTRAGFIRQSSSGIYTLLPLALRSLEKLEKIIDIELGNIGAQKLSLPILLSSSGWKKTGRWESSGEELFRLKDRKKSEFCLAPTHEEEITQLIANEITSYRQLPLRLYQIGRKYRDEMRPRSGLLRGREFIMKDLYTFDTTEELALQTYQEVMLAYKKIFEKIGLPFSIAKADAGNIGGTQSHEFHFLSEAGEDFILACSKCGYNENIDVNNSFKENVNMLPNILHGDCQNTSIGDGCPICAKDDKNNFVPLTVHRAIEVGHSFLLGTKYSEPLKATFAPQNPKVPGELLPIQMGCYGLGTSRMLAAIIESSHDKNGIIWPISVAPYRVCIIPGFDEPLIESTTSELHDILNYKFEILKDEIVIDDRTNLSLGYRMKDAELIGYPWVVVLGKKFLENGKIEIQERQNKTKSYLNVQDLDKLSSWL